MAMQKLAFPGLSQSKVREISWRVAEPLVKYDPDRASAQLFSQPFKWLGRNVQIFVPVTLFVGKVLSDLLLNREEANRKKRANELLDIISAQSPALIKAGQALASRSDLLHATYLDALQKLQDRVPPFSTEQAVQLFEQELGRPFGEVFELEEGDLAQLQPVAAASIGQVYKAKLRSNGAKVAIKIQRPNCEENIAVDLYVLRWYAQQIQKVLRLLNRDLDLVSIIDDFGDLIYREIDYRAEAVNAQRFAELYASIPDVFVPKVYTDLSTSKVLTMEWVDGARLNDKAAIASMGFESSRFVDILVQCSLRQMLDNGFFHADPHAGNLLAMPSGKLCYLDFGMVSYVEASQRYSIIEAIVHMVNRDFVSLAELYRRMGFIPRDVDISPIVQALEAALPDVLNSAVGDFNFKSVVSKLGDVMYKFPFSLPPFYIAIIRCLGVLEGLAIQVDDEFRIISDAYPYIASRLLTDPSDELQAALKQLLFRDGSQGAAELRWDRLQELLQEASATSDYDVSLAMEQMVSYLVSEQGRGVRELLAAQLVTTLDQLQDESAGLLTRRQWGAADVAAILERINAPPTSQATSTAAVPPWQRFNLRALNENILGRVSEAALALLLELDLADAASTSSSSSSASSSSSLAAARKLVSILKASNFTTDKAVALGRKVLREPVLQELLSRVVSEVSERVAARTVRRAFGG